MSKKESQSGNDFFCSITLFSVVGFGFADTPALTLVLPPNWYTKNGFLVLITAYSKSIFR